MQWRNWSYNKRGSNLNQLRKKSLLQNVGQSSIQHPFTLLKAKIKKKWTC